jgi:hypothetical protein
MADLDGVGDRGLDGGVVGSCGVAPRPPQGGLRLRGEKLWAAAKGAAATPALRRGNLEIENREIENRQFRSRRFPGFRFPMTD